MTSGVYKDIYIYVLKIIKIGMVNQGMSPVLNKYHLK